MKSTEPFATAYDDDARFIKLLQADYDRNTMAKTTDENDITVKQFINVITNSPQFERVIMVAIVINSVLIAIKTFPDSAISPLAFDMLDIIFLVLYTTEFVLKITSSGFSYFLSNYNRFDFFVLMVSAFDFIRDVFELEISANIEYLRVLRALRALRALRSISFVRSLQIIVVALLKTIYSIGNLLLLLMLIMYVFAIAGYYFFGQDNNDNQLYWGDLPKTLYTLWVLVTADGWTFFQNELDRNAPGQELSRLFTSTFVFVGNFVFTNLFIGIVIDNLDQAQAEEQHYRNTMRNSAISRKKRFLRDKQKKEIVALLAARKGIVKQSKEDVVTNLEKAFKQLEGSLRNDDIRIMRNPCCHPIWIEIYLNTLKCQDNCLFRSQQLSFEIANTLVSLYECNMGLQQANQVAIPRHLQRSKSTSFH